MMEAAPCGSSGYLIDISSPDALERDFYAWLNGEELSHRVPSQFYEEPEKAAETGHFYPQEYKQYDYDDTPELVYLSPAYALPPPGLSPFKDASDCRSPLEAHLGSSPASVSSADSGVGIDYAGVADDPMARSSGCNQLGRRYSPGLPLSMAEREQIVQLHLNNWKICDISKRLAVTHSCVSKILNRYRQTGSVRPKDAKEGRTESPLVRAIRDYRARLGITRQSDIREQLIADGICTRENAPSRSSINHILRTKLDIKKRKRGA